MTENKKVCAFCGVEIGAVRTNKDGSTMLNLHVTEKGSIEKCYTERKKPWRWIFGKKNYRGIAAEYITPPIEFKPAIIGQFSDIIFSKKKLSIPEEKQNKRYKCPECGEISDAKDWMDTDLECEVCGSHSGIVCPICDEAIDMVFTREEELDINYIPPEPMKIEKFIGISFEKKVRE